MLARRRRADAAERRAPWPRTDRHGVDDHRAVAEYSRAHERVRCGARLLRADGRERGRLREAGLAEDSRRLGESQDRMRVATEPRRDVAPNGLGRDGLDRILHAGLRTHAVFVPRGSPRRQFAAATRRLDDQGDATLGGQRADSLPAQYYDKTCSSGLAP